METGASFAPISDMAIVGLSIERAGDHRHSPVEGVGQ